MSSSLEQQVMYKVSLLVERFLDGNLRTEEFAEHFMSIWHSTIDEQHRIINDNPDLREARMHLEQALERGRISIADYESRMKELYSTITDWSVMPFSQTDLFLNQLFTAVENYDADPELQADGYSDESQLRNEINIIFRKFK